MIDKKYKRLTIRTPIWKTKSIGIAEYRLNTDILLDISYKNSKGDKMFPGYFYIDKEEAKSYPIQNVHNTDLRIIPIAKLREIEYEEPRE